MSGLLSLKILIVLLEMEVMFVEAIPVQRAELALPFLHPERENMERQQYFQQHCQNCRVASHSRKHIPTAKRHYPKLPRSISIPSEATVKDTLNVDDGSSPFVTLSGYSVHLECVRNSEGRQVPPCILKLSDAVTKNGKQRSLLSQIHRDHRHYEVKQLTFRIGEFAYLPCRTLGAGDEDTTIWEKGDSPLFASTTKFSKDERIHLITRNDNIGQIGSDVQNNNQYSSWNKTWQRSYGGDGFDPNEKISQWDLVINFLQPLDSDIYTCRLVGRTQQLIRYHVEVKDSKPLVIYSTKKLVQMAVPQLVNLGQPFNLTCSVQLSQTNSAYITVDWFRPDHTYDGLQQSMSTYSNQTVPLTLIDSPNGSDPPARNQITAVISWFAQSFMQITSQPNFGTSVFKQLRIEKDFTYRSEAVFKVQKATPFEEGFYECRAYEPANYGHERVLDRAITAVLVNRPYPQKPVENGKWLEKFGYMLASHWNLLSESELRQHDQHAQNDGGIKVINWLYPAPRLKSIQKQTGALPTLVIATNLHKKLNGKPNSAQTIQLAPMEAFLFVIFQTTLYFSM